MSLRSRLSQLGILSLIWAGLASPVAAHGEEGMAQLVDAPAGPYLLTVRTSPNPARPGPIQVLVVVVDGSSGRPVTNADLTIKARPPGGGNGDVIIAQPAGGWSEAGFNYEANLDLESIGAYQMTVSVAGPGGQGEAAFQLEIGSAGVTTWFVMALSAITLPATAWMIKESITTWRKHVPNLGRSSSRPCAAAAII